MISYLQLQYKFRDENATSPRIASISLKCFLAAAMCAFAFARTPHGFAQQSTNNAPPKQLLQAHSHNDYEHPRPLFDALDRGFCSIEADVYLVDGELLVAHDLHKTSKDRTLRSLYLEPLFERFQKADGNDSSSSSPMELLLLVDIKSNGKAAVQELHRQLLEYAPMISYTENDKFIRKAVTVIVSGDRSWETIQSFEPRYVGIDGRLNDLGSNHSANLVPLVSDNWRNHFKWRGAGDMPENEKEKLVSLAKQAHEEGRKLRFWATPESEAVWKELLKAKVDLIGTDDLERLKKFLAL